MTTTLVLVGIPLCSVDVVARQRSNKGYYSHLALVMKYVTVCPRKSVVRFDPLTSPSYHRGGACVKRANLHLLFTF